MLFSHFCTSSNLETKPVKSHPSFSIVTDRTPKESRWRRTTPPYIESQRSLERVLNLGDHDRSWTSHKCFNIIIFHGYRQNPKRTPLMTNKSALHKVARLLELVLRLGGREPSLTSESLEMVSKQLYRIQAVFRLAPIVLVLLIKVLTLGLV